MNRPQINRPKIVLNRAQFKTLKKTYTLERFIEFLQDIYVQGYAHGYNRASSEAQQDTASLDGEPLEKALRELLRKEFKIGDKRYEDRDMENKIKELISEYTVHDELTEMTVRRVDNEEADNDDSIGGSMESSIIEDNFKRRGL